jgi:hypothetical protein
MLYYVLNNGLELASPRAGVVEDVLRLIRPLVACGGRLPAPYLDYEVEIAHKPGGALFSVWHNKLPLLTAGIVWQTTTAPKIWELLEGIYLDVSDHLANEMGAQKRPICPDAVPWVSVIQFPAYPKTTPTGLGWCGDFVRSFAWSILENQAPGQ